MLPPQRSDRNDYSPLRDLENKPLEPTRPDTIRSPGWTDRGDMESQNAAAREWAKVANQRLEQQRDNVQQNPGDAREQSAPLNERSSGGRESSTPQESARGREGQQGTGKDDVAVAREAWEKTAARETQARSDAGAAKYAWEQVVSGDSSRHQAMDQAQALQRKPDIDRSDY